MDKNSNGTGLALYRKYRPQKFADVVGQTHVVKVLEAAAKRGTPAHAYLFCGSRGTGKTSVARILARALGTSENDLSEIDAASNRGIDDIRELREAVRVHPFESKYKVYIIDEAHMLTKEAFNALLKTLEEPPAHVIFILATTEMEKLPETVVSRCELHTFKKPSEEILKEVAEDVAQKEGGKISPEGAELVAVLGDGSFRDTLGILQKVMGYSKSKSVGLEEVEAITGAPKRALIDGFLLALFKKDAAQGFESIAAAKKDNIDMKVYMKLILHRLRSALLVKYAPEVAKRMLGAGNEGLSAFVEAHGAGISSALLKELLEAYSQIEHSVIPELPLELAVAKLAGETK